MRNDFVALILTHGRPDRVYTIPTLEKCGYTGDWLLVVDNEDRTVDEYRERYGDERVVVFDKLAESLRTDAGDNFDDRRVVVYARNVAADIARERGYKYLVVLDDDYTEFKYRYDEKFRPVTGWSLRADGALDSVFEALVEFIETTPYRTVALSQGGDWIGGHSGPLRPIRLTRKAMNSFVYAVDEPLEFLGRINEDTTTYTTFGNRGVLYGTTMQVSLDQHQTQQNPGGLTDIYLDKGTYFKSIYSVMWTPSAVKIGILRDTGHGGDNPPRIHHSIAWNNCVPKIVREDVRKPR